MVGAELVAAPPNGPERGIRRDPRPELHG